LASAADGIRLELSGPACPYEKVVYEVTRKRGAVVVTVVKAFRQGFGRHERVGLLDDAAFTVLMARIAQTQVGRVSQRKKPAHRLRRRVQVNWKGRESRIVVDDAVAFEDVEVLAVWKAVRAVVRARTRPAPFWDAMLLSDEAGFLRVQSKPVARVFVNGVDTQSNTPLSSLRLPAGKHLIELRSTADGEPYDYPITIEIGKTTVLAVELR
jgi:hypothetical protein